jgi:hypothetical protein
MMTVRKRETFPPVTMAHIRGHGCRDCSSTATPDGALHVSRWEGDHLENCHQEPASRFAPPIINVFVMKKLPSKAGTYHGPIPYRSSQGQLTVYGSLLLNSSS